MQVYFRRVIQISDNMKHKIFSVLFLFALYNVSIAQSAPYQVVIDVTSSDTMVHKMVIRWISEITSSAPDAKVDVVLFAKSLDMITKGKSVVSSDVTNYARDENVSFKVCAMAMKNTGVEANQLLPGVGTVPDGIYEIISRQHDGWGYIKAAR